MQEKYASSDTLAQRHYSLTDRLLMGAQSRFAGAEQIVAGARAPVLADHPGAREHEAPLDEKARRHAAGLMRVNHAGEVAAQALYQGQAMVARDAGVRKHMLHAAGEELQHLRWCELRLKELGDHPSRLSPLWYASSFVMGAAVGLAGDRTSLGFVEETERQVVEHLEDHLGSLPPQDTRSRAILQAMQADETRHGDEAAAAGAVPLPPPVRKLMAAVSKVMKLGAYRI